MQTNKIATEITRLSLSRKVTVFVFFLTILAVGLIAVGKLPLEKFPKGQDYNYIRIRTGWSSGVAEEAMQKIGLPMEEELSTVRGIQSINTRSSQSAAEVSLSFKRGTDMDVAYREGATGWSAHRCGSPRGSTNTESPSTAGQARQSADCPSDTTMTITFTTTSKRIWSDPTADRRRGGCRLPASQEGDPN